MTSYTDAEILAVVQRSPAAAGRHDRDEWVGLFTTDGTVEDPVGSAPHRGHNAIGRFYETFIAPREVIFHPDADIVSGMTVIRDLTLEVRMGAGVTMMIPAILRYVVRGTDSGLRIAELQAFWELPQMLGQFVRRGVPAVPVALGLSRSLLTNQHIGGALGFLTGLHRPAQRQRPTTEALVRALTGGDQLTARRLLGTGAGVTLGDDEPAAIDALGTRLRGASEHKRITAGATTAVSLRSAQGPVVLLIDTEPLAVRCYG
ncbi:nuclear transport factor 2 family protein [Mycolicibacterium mengxianglii]|uniref:nuclear transport factor 2 family protein n=1 Tax=Mycolicibacterium mengxianglii TaxID=2736649 RepID=UPI0018D0069D|nr:ketosteroid isomerase family protein [Mycolicibacterium mengxianglii]